MGGRPVFALSRYCWLVEMASRVALAALAGLVAPAITTVPMNVDAPGGPGGTYKIANPPPGKSAYVNASRHAHRGEYIEVYSDNISTHYGEVCFRRLCATRARAESCLAVSLNRSVWTACVL